MKGRQLAITSDQTQLVFKKLDKPYLESVPKVVDIVYYKVDEREDTKEFIFQTMEGIVDAANS